MIINDIESWILSHNDTVWSEERDEELEYCEPPSYPNLICEEIDQVLNDGISITREVVISLALTLFYRTIIEENPSLKELVDNTLAAAQYYGHT